MQCKSISNNRAIIRLYTKRLRWISLLVYSYPEKKQIFSCFTLYFALYFIVFLDSILSMVCHHINHMWRPLTCQSFVANLMTICDIFHKYTDHIIILKLCLIDFYQKSKYLSDRNNTTVVWLTAF